MLSMGICSNQIAIFNLRPQAKSYVNYMEFIPEKKLVPSNSRDDGLVSCKI